MKVLAARVDEDFRDAMVDVMWENLFSCFYTVLVRGQARVSAKRTAPDGS